MLPIWDMHICTSQFWKHSEVKKGVHGWKIRFWDIFGKVQDGEGNMHPTSGFGKSRTLAMNERRLENNDANLSMIRDYRFRQFQNYLISRHCGGKRLPSHTAGDCENDEHTFVSCHPTVPGFM